MMKAIAVTVLFSVLAIPVYALGSEPATQKVAPSAGQAAPAGAAISKKTQPTVERRKAPQPTKAVLRQAIERRPLTFAPAPANGSGAIFIAQGERFSLLLEHKGLTVHEQHARQLASGRKDDSKSAASADGSESPTPAEFETSTAHIDFVGTNPEAKIEGLDPVVAYANYFIGSDPAKWRTHVAQYSRVRYKDLYPGIDLVYYGRKGSQLEYDLVVSPGADPSQIRLHVADDREIHLDEAGNLPLDGKDGSISLGRPMLYQDIDNGKRVIAGQFVQVARNEFAFRAEKYDHTRPLIIDPTISIVYATYAGGIHDDSALNMALDSNGAAYITGYTASEDFPVSSSALQTTRSNVGTYTYDAFVMKFDASGTLLYSTFLGGSSTDTSRGIAVDSSGNAYIVGDTQSSDFPVTSNAYQKTSGGGHDAFLAKISSDGSNLMYSTYLGGSGDEYAQTIFMNSDGTLWMAGQASGTGLPATSGAYQTAPSGSAGFIAHVEFNAANAQSLQIDALTYLGGSTSSAGSNIYDLSLDATGNVYVAGLTTSTDYPVTANAYQNPSAFTLSGGCYNSPHPNSIATVSELSSDLKTLIYSTVVGGKTEDQNGYPDCNQFVHTVHADGKGNIWVVGTTGMQDFPTTSNALSTQLNGNGSAGVDLIVTELTPATSSTALTYSTYLGGSQFDYGPRAVWDANNNIWIVATSQSTDWPGIVQGTSLQPANAGGYDATITKLSADGASILYSTYLGGSGDEDSDLGDAAIRIDSGGNVRIAGATKSSNFPVTSDAFQSVIANGDSGYDGSDVYYAVLGTGTIGTVGPVVGGNSGDTTITIGGAGFESGATCKLVQNGTTITATSAAVNSTGTSITCTFALNGAIMGSYNVVVTNSDGTTFTKDSAFTVEAGSGPNIWLNVVGRSAIRFNTATTFTVSYGNSGDTDAIGVPIFISVPTGSTVQLTTALAPIPKVSDFDPSTLPTSYQVNGTTVIPIFIPRIAAGGSGSVQIQVTIPDTSTTFEVDAYNWKPFASSMADFAQAFGSGTQTYIKKAQGLNVLPNGVTLDSGAASKCIQDLVQLGLQVAGSLVPGTACATSAAGFFSSAVTTLIAANDPGFSASDAGSNLGQLYAAGGQAALNCAMTAASITPVGLAVNAALSLIQGALAGASAAADCSQVAQPDNSQGKKGKGVGAVDPNYKAGPIGDGSTSQYVASNKALTYSLGFENEATATAPAATVIVTDQLDTTKVNPATLSLGAISWGAANVINPPAGATSYATTYTPSGVTSYKVKIQGSLNTSTGLLKWTFQTIDPSTGVAPTDPTVGFLPPDTDGIVGQGSVIFNVTPQPGQATGTQITNTASVVFDSNAAISTPTWLNTLDADAPVSSVTALPAAEITAGSTATFTVNWSGTDKGAGIAIYNIYVSDNGGAFTLWQSAVTATSASYTGTVGHTYGFYSVATDKAGNVEASKSVADTTTTASNQVATTTTLIASSASAGSGTAITFTATVTETSGSVTPTGTVTFYDGTTSLGTGTLSSSGIATYSTSSLAVGTHSITASYGGNAGNLSSTSTAVSVVVGTPNFSLSLSPTTVSIASGGSGTTTVTVTPAFGFASAITFACSGLPAHATCNFSPATVTPSGSAASTTTLTIATNVASASLRKDLPTSRPNERAPLLCIVVLGAFGLLRARRQRRALLRSARSLVVLAILLATLAGGALIGCGGGSSNSTPAGTSTVTITATGGSQTLTATLSVTVQ